MPKLEASLASMSVTSNDVSYGDVSAFIYIEEMIQDSDESGVLSLFLLLLSFNMICKPDMLYIFHAHMELSIYKSSIYREVEHPKCRVSD
jgi:hypothetical protein